MISKRDFILRGSCFCEKCTAFSLINSDVNMKAEELYTMLSDIVHYNNSFNNTDTLYIIITVLVTRTHCAL